MKLTLSFQLSRFLYTTKTSRQKLKYLEKERSFSEATSKTWTRTLDLDPEKPGPLKTWTLKNLDPQKHEANIGLKYMSDFKQLYFIKTMRNVIYCLKVFQAKNCSCNNSTVKRKS